MDGLKSYDPIRAAFRALGKAEEKEAREALRAANVIGFSENLKLNSAFSVVREFLEKLDRIESQQNRGESPSDPASRP